MAQAYRDLGVSESVLRRGKRQFTENPTEAFPGKGRLRSQDEELARLHRENEVSRQERDILKKAVGIFSRAPKLNICLSMTIAAGFRQGVCAERWRFHPAGYYAWLKRGESRRVREDRRLLVEIKAIHREKRGAYGSPRIHAELKDRPLRHGKKRVARLMRENGIRGKTEKEIQGNHRFQTRPSGGAQFAPA